MTNIDLWQYETNPNVSTLITLSDSCAALNNHESAMLFAESALREKNITPKQQIQILQRMSITAFYSKLPYRKELGRTACEFLSMNKHVPVHTRYLASQNGTWYAKSATDIMPDTNLTPVNFTPPNDYMPMNPSIYRWNNQLWMIQRTVNYVITESGQYDMQGDTAIRTTNWLIQLNDDLSVKSTFEILPPTDLPAPLYNLVLGFEDCRLFVWQDQLWCTSTVRELNIQGNCEIVLSRIDPIEGSNKYIFSNYRVIHPQDVEFQHQKNWMPLVDDNTLKFIYSSDPVRIIGKTGNTVCLNTSAVASDSFRGGSQAIRFDNGWLAVIHESLGMPDHRRRYMHRFVWYDNDYKIQAYSQAFYLHTLGIEFVAGIAINPVTNNIVVSFGLADKESWLATFTPNNIRDILIKVSPLKFTISNNDAEWIQSQTNTALLDTSAVTHATNIISELGLKQHEDAVKNWDNLQSLWHTINTTQLDEYIIDIGATPGSAYLPSLAAYGYKNLISINLTDNESKIIDGVTYQYGDCTNTTFPDNHFGFVSCLSVIEHGVDVAMFFKESVRILKQDGHLYLSTDYWQDSVDTRGQMAFGVPVRIFTRDDITNMVEIAKSVGLELTTPINLDCKDRVVNWIGMDYTFVNLLFRKI